MLANAIVLTDRIPLYDALRKTRAVQTGLLTAMLTGPGPGGSGQ